MISYKKYHSGKSILEAPEFLNNILQTGKNG